MFVILFTYLCLSITLRHCVIVQSAAVLIQQAETGVQLYVCLCVRALCATQ